MATPAQQAGTLSERRNIQSGVIARYVDFLTLPVSLALFVAACLSPAVERYGGNRYGPNTITDWGWQYLISGWAAPIHGIWAWYANPLIVLAWVCIILAMGSSLPWPRILSALGQSPDRVLSTLINGSLGCSSFACRLTALLVSGLAFLIGMTTFSYIYEYRPALGSGNPFNVKTYEIGVYLWLASMVTVTAFTALQVAVQILATAQRRLGHSTL